MKDPADPRFPLDYDGYLKEWQLSNPNLPFDNIMVDQAEHFSDAMLNIVLKQQCHRIIVGDPHQHIFPFRAEHSPFDAIEATHTFYLTRVISSNLKSSGDSKINKLCFSLSILVQPLGLWLIVV